MPGVWRDRLRGVRADGEVGRGGRPGPNGTTIPNPIVVCRRCGQQEREVTFFGSMASWRMRRTRQHVTLRVASARAHAREQRWYANTMTLRAVMFPIYAAEGRPAVIEQGVGSPR